MAWFSALFRLTPETRVLDVGGSTFNWRLLEQSATVTLLNLTVDYVGEGASSFTVVVGDGCRLPFRSGAFDIVFCNSVIEHLTPPRQRILADEIRRVGTRYFVETPNYWFPIEPHFIAPFFHWLPRSLRRQTARWITFWGWIVRPSREESTEMVDEIHLLTPSGFSELFPGAELHSERFIGLPKSLIAVSTAGGGDAALSGGVASGI